MMMGAPGQPELGAALTNSFCRSDPDMAYHFARVTFLSVLRGDLPQMKTPTLILQCDDDFIAPQAVGNYMQRVMPRAKLALIDNVGHCPHMSAPAACTEAMVAFLADIQLP